MSDNPTLKDLTFLFKDNETATFEEAELQVNPMGFFVVVTGNKRRCYNVENVMCYSYEIVEEESFNDMGDNVVSIQ